MQTIWGIHNDRDEIDPTTGGEIRIGWDEVGDLARLEPTRDAFRSAVETAFPDLKPGVVPGTAGTLYRFVHEIKDGDLIVCPDRKNRTLRIGRAQGPYSFHEEYPLYRHTRPVQWLKTGVSRDVLSIPAQNEIGSATTLFKISTAKEEIEALIDNQAHSAGDPDFGWAPFYRELADRILNYRNDREELIRKVFRIADASGLPRLFKYLRTDHDENGKSKDISDIDPFTVFGPFNRGITHDARVRIAEAYREEFDITAPAPTGFAGIPILNNLNSWFIRFEKERAADEVELLWDLADAAVAYSQEINESTTEALVSTFDAATKGQTRQLTMGLFWIRPESFTAYDGNNASYITETFPDLAEQLTLTARLTGDQYVANTQTITSWLGSPGAPESIPELSYDAYLSTRIEEPAAGFDDAEDEISTVVDDSYAVETIIEDGAFFSPEELASILDTLNRKKNLILQGPPGTGKTWLARRLAWTLCGRRSDAQVEVLQFHPSMSYEDFVRGWRPSSSGNLELSDGPFIRFCQKAAEDPENNYVLVLEEINRGNPAQIFGELLTLIENTKRNENNAMRLSYPKTDGETFFVPPNVFIIGTMNVADRSLAMVDMALRRRFAFIDLEPRIGDQWVEFVSGKGYNRSLLEAFVPRIAEVNELITTDHNLGRQYRIGHSFFVPLKNATVEDDPAATRAWIREVLNSEIIPLLDEYWFDQPDKVDRAAMLLRAAG